MRQTIKRSDIKTNYISNMSKYENQDSSKAIEDDSYWTYEQRQIILAKSYLKRLIDVKYKIMNLKLPCIPKSLPKTAKNSGSFTSRSFKITPKKNLHNSNKSTMASKSNFFPGKQSQSSDKPKTRIILKRRKYKKKPKIDLFANVSK